MNLSGVCILSIWVGPCQTQHTGNSKILRVFIDNKKLFIDNKITIYGNLLSIKTSIKTHCILLFPVCRDYACVLPCRVFSNFSDPENNTCFLASTNIEKPWLSVNIANANNLLVLEFFNCCIFAQNQVPCRGSQQGENKKLFFRLHKSSLVSQMRSENHCGSLQTCS